MTLKIYGVLRSRASRVIWMAKELDIPYERIDVIQAKRVPNPLAADAPLNTSSPSFVAVNPNALIPSIDDDGYVLNESLAINLYLARKHGGPLAPADIREDGLIAQWTLWVATECETPALRVMQNGPSAKTRDAALYDASLKSLGTKFQVLEKALQDGKGHLVGGRFTVADVNIAEILRYAQGAEDLFTQFPAVKQWFTACLARPAYVEMAKERNAEPM
jgi:glutathione S-transferase